MSRRTNSQTSFTTVRRNTSCCLFCGRVAVTKQFELKFISFRWFYWTSYF